MKLFLMLGLVLISQLTFAQDKSKKNPKVNPNIEHRATKRTNELKSLIKLTKEQENRIWSAHLNFITRNNEILSDKSLSDERKKTLIRKSNQMRWKMIRSELTKEQIKKLEGTKYQERLDKTSHTIVK